MTLGGKGKNRGGKTIDGGKSNETINGYAVSYFKKFSKCNKPNCTVCSKEGGGHGPYWYKKYRTRNGKSVTKYVGKVKPDQAQEQDEETE